MTDGNSTPAFAELLACPRCGGAMSLRQAIATCDQCGYAAGEVVECEEYPVELYDPITLIAWEMTRGRNIGRAFLHACVSRFVEPRGVTLDLGAGKRPAYAGYFRSQPSLYVRADGVPESDPDLLVNLEQPLPLRSASVDTVIAFNLIEHLYDHRLVLAEARRVLRPDGTLYLYVPYLVRIHGFPHDYFRYTHLALHRLLRDAGFTDVAVYATGGYARFVPKAYMPLGKIGIGYAFYPLTVGFLLIDRLIHVLSRGRHQLRVPCGYFSIARGGSCQERQAASATRVACARE